MKGCYLLLIELKNDIKISIGKLGDIKFKKGYYTYIGSALNGLEQRINRHLKTNKKTHWHIDYLLKHTKIINIYYKENIIREECTTAEKLKSHLVLIQGFGCSDCNCKSHLFYGSKDDILNVINSLKLRSYNY